MQSYRENVFRRRMLAIEPRSIFKTCRNCGGLNGISCHCYRDADTLRCSEWRTAG